MNNHKILLLYAINYNILKNQLKNFSKIINFIINSNKLKNVILFD